MKKAIYSFIYYRLLGWKTNVTVPNYDKCVICAAPHTTNLDLFIGKLFYGAIGRKGTDRRRCRGDGCCRDPHGKEND